jgi:hypothetical protein
MWSMMKGTDTGLLKEAKLNPKSTLPVLRTAVHWSIANFAAHCFQVTQPYGSYCRIKYEDLIKNPEIICELLGNFLGVSLERQAEAIRKGGEIEKGHIIAGNRMRSRKNIKIRADLEWERSLNLGYNLLFWFLNWPMMMYYKYKLKHLDHY